MSIWYWITGISVAAVLDAVFIWVWRQLNRRRSRSRGGDRPASSHLEANAAGPQRAAPRQSMASQLKAKVGRVPAEVVLVPAVLIAALSQMSFDTGEPGRTLGIVLFLALFPVVWLFAYLESRSPAPSEWTGLDLSPSLQSSGATAFAQLTTAPWRTFLATLSLIAVASCASLARDVNNNLAAGLSWLAGVGLFLAACWPAKLLPDFAKWKAAFSRHWIEILLVAVILAVGSFARLYALDRIPVGVEQDEGQFGIDVLRILNGERYSLFSVARFDYHPAVFPLIQSVGLTLLGKNTAALRLPSGIAGSLSFIFMCLLVWRMFGPGLALVAGVLLACAPYHLMFSRIGAYDMVVLQLGLAATFYFLYRGLHSRRGIDFALAGVSLGVGLWLDYNNKTMILIPIVGAALVHLIITQRRYFRSEYPKIGLLLVGVVIAMLPIWSTYAYNHQLERDLTQGRFIFAPLNIGHVTSGYDTSNKLVIVAHQVERTLFGLNYFGDASHNAIAGRRPMLDGLTSVFFFIGLAYGAWHWKEPRYGVLILWWGIGLQAGIWAIDPPSAHRLSSIIFPTYLLAAVGMGKVGMAWAKTWRWDRGIYLGVIAALVLGYVTFKNFSTFFSRGSYPLSWLETTKVGEIIKDWSADHDVYFLGAPWAYGDGHGAIMFSSQLTSLSAINVEDVRAVVPLKQAATRDIAFIMSAGHYDDLSYIQHYYPGGTLKEWYDDYWKETYLKTYLITQQDANTPAVGGQ